MVEKIFHIMLQNIFTRETKNQQKKSFTGFKILIRQTEKNGYNLRLDSSGKCIVSEETREKCKQSQIERS